MSPTPPMRPDRLRTLMQCCLMVLLCFTGEFQGAPSVVLAAEGAVSSVAASPPEPSTVSQRLSQWVQTQPGSSAVVLQHETDYRLGGWGGSTLTTTNHVAIWILTPAGRSESRVMVPLGPWDKLVNFRAGVYPIEQWMARLDRGLSPWAQDVALKSVPRALMSSFDPATDPVWWEMLAIPSYGFLYSDTRVRGFDVPGTAVGMVLEYEVTVSSRERHVAPLIRVATELPVWQREVSVHFPKNCGVRWSEFDAGKPVASHPRNLTDQHGRVEGYAWSWSRTSVPKREPYAPPLPWLIPSLRLSFYALQEGQVPTVEQDWNSLVAWYNRLTKDYYALPEGEAARALTSIQESLKGEGKQSLSTQALLFYFVRDRIRYVATHEGLGGLRPHKATEVLDSGFGDCKDKATLLIALYRQLGLEAWPVWIGVHPSRPFEAEMPDLASFDHAIVALSQGNSFHFVDPTASNASFEQLPVPDQGRDVVVAQPQGARLARTPVSGVEDNTQSLAWQLDLVAGTMTVELVAKGKQAAAFRDLWQSDRTGTTLRQYWQRAAGVEPQTLTVDDQTEDQRSDFRVTAQFSAQPFVQTLGREQWIPLTELFDTSAEIRIPKSRKSPVILGYSGRFIDSLSVTLPPNRAAVLPAVQSHALPWVQHSRTCEQTAQAILCRRTLELRAGATEQLSLEGLRSLSEWTLDDARQSIVVKGATP